MCSRNTLLLKERTSGQSGVILALDQFTGVVLQCASPEKVQWPTLGRTELVERRLSPGDEGNVLSPSR